MSMATPPRLAVMLLGLVTHEDDRESLLADLESGFVERASDPAIPSTAARVPGEISAESGRNVPGRSEGIARMPGSRAIARSASYTLRNSCSRS